VRRHAGILAATLLLACAPGRPPTGPPALRWRLVQHETFDQPFAEPAAWTEDRYGDRSPYHVDAFDEDGAFFVDRGGAAFLRGLGAFRSFRFIHHHRKVVMDTDNNFARGASWSRVWYPQAGRAVEEGSHYVSMIWLRGDDFGSDWTGNEFVSFTPAGWQPGPTFVDQYLDDEPYVFVIERDGERYTLSVAGRFRHGGRTTYRASRRFRDAPPTWHYNQTPQEYAPPHYNQVRTYGGQEHQTWPAGSAYPDHFFFGDPHINYYEGTAEFSDLKLYLPEPRP
jgi:hypothetical protein